MPSVGAIAFGSVTVNELPSVVLLTLIVPPWALITASVMGRPSPVLPAARDRDPSPREPFEDVGQ